MSTDEKPALNISFGLITKNAFSKSSKVIKQNNETMRFLRIVLLISLFLLRYRIMKLKSIILTKNKANSNIISPFLF